VCLIVRAAARRFSRPALSRTRRGRPGGFGAAHRPRHGTHLAGLPGRESVINV